MITLTEYRSFPIRTLGLGQDVSQDITDIVRVASLFKTNSKVHKELTDGLLKKVTLDIGAPIDLYEFLLEALSKTDLTHAELVTRYSKEGRKPYASGLVRAIFKGQKSAAITDWAASNYVSVAVALGLIDLDYSLDVYKLTTLGESAIELMDNNDPELKDFMLDRLYEYPYAAWLIRLVNKQANREYSKFDLGEAFGFIDEPGFISFPEKQYLDALAIAESMEDTDYKKEVKSNYESTADKYMRWLAGVLVNYGLLSKRTKKVDYSWNGSSYILSAGPSYQVTALGIRALKRVNGGSRYPRSKKRVRWEYLATKVTNASLKKTTRALILKFLSESPRGLSSIELAERINNEIKTLGAIPEQISDDIKGLNRIGIEVKFAEDRYILKDELYDFDIPIKVGESLKKDSVGLLKDKLRVQLKHIDHSYLKGIDIAYKSKTTNQENTQFEILSTQLFVNEVGYTGEHLGGVNKPDGYAYNQEEVWIIDSKAYHNGFTVDAIHLDPMRRYIDELKQRDSINSNSWWQAIPLETNKQLFVYVSGSFRGQYKKQISKFRRSVGVNGGLLEYQKLLILAERIKGNSITLTEFRDYILDDNLIEYSEYSEQI